MAILSSIVFAILKLYSLSTSTILSSFVIATSFCIFILAILQSLNLTFNPFSIARSFASTLSSVITFSIFSSNRLAFIADNFNFLGILLSFKLLNVPPWIVAPSTACSFASFTCTPLKSIFEFSLSSSEMLGIFILFSFSTESKSLTDTVPDSFSNSIFKILLLKFSIALSNLVIYFNTLFISFSNSYIFCASIILLSNDFLSLSLAFSLTTMFWAYFIFSSNNFFASAKSFFTNFSASNFIVSSASLIIFTVVFLSSTFIVSFCTNSLNFVQLFSVYSPFKSVYFFTVAKYLSLAIFMSFFESDGVVVLLPPPELPDPPPAPADVIVSIFSLPQIIDSLFPSNLSIFPFSLSTFTFSAFLSIIAFFIFPSFSISEPSPFSLTCNFSISESLFIFNWASFPSIDISDIFPDTDNLAFSLTTTLSIVALSVFNIDEPFVSLTFIDLILPLFMKVPSLISFTITS